MEKKPKRRTIKMKITAKMVKELREKKQVLE